MTKFEWKHNTAPSVQVILPDKENIVIILSVVFFY